MPENSGNVASHAEVGTLLRTIAELLRHAREFGPEAQALLADLIDELGVTLESREVANAEIAKLTECASQFVKAVSEKHDEGVLQGAQDRLERAVVSVETKAPHLADLTRQLAEMLANLGI